VGIVQGGGGACAPEVIGSRGLSIGWRNDRQISARNQLKGTLKSVGLGAIMAEVVVAIGDQEIVAAITRGSTERLGLKEGGEVTVIIKATEVMIATGS
jgi:molybdopterin-binding protein